MNLPPADEKEFEDMSSILLDVQDGTLLPIEAYKQLKSYLAQKRIEWIVEELERIQKKLNEYDDEQAEIDSYDLPHIFRSYLDSRLKELRK